MAKEVDHYAVLGIARGAGLDEIKAAYRKAALACHPDSHDGDPAEAERKLRALIVAYKTILKSVDPAAWGPTPSPDGRIYTPQDFAREGGAAHWRPGTNPAGDGSDLPDHDVVATRNETRTFIILWAVAIVLGIVVGGAAACYRAYSVGPENLTKLDIAISVIFGEVIYVTLAVATVFLIILTRKIVKLTIQWAAQWRFLPAPGGRDLPHHPAAGGPQGQPTPDGPDVEAHAPKAEVDGEGRKRA